MKVKVQITETLQRIVEVCVVDKTAAINTVADDYRDEKLILDADDFKGVEFEVVK